MSLQHPRPQLTRTDWRSLNGHWGYRTDPDSIGVGSGWHRGPREVFDRTILVPFPPESADSGVGEEPGGAMWYRTELPAGVLGAGARRILYFEAVDYAMDLWVNGEHCTHHEGGFAPVRVDVTDALVDDGPQVVVVRAVDNQHDLEQPRGKQDWECEPHVIWYERTSGIWREVWMEDVPQTHVAALRWETDPIAGVVSVVVDVAGARVPTPTWLASGNRPLLGGGGNGTSLQVEVELFCAGRRLSFALQAVTGDRASLRFNLAEAVGDSELHSLWWTPEHPVLIDARVRVRDETDVLDVVGSYVGLRSVGTTRSEFLLNERPYYLRLVLEQAYWPSSHLAAPDQEALRREAELIKDLGFNGLRMHQTTADPRFLEWCDRLGLVVWVDAPAAFRFSERSLSRTVSGWTEIVARDRNHPCVVAWVPFNESWGVEQVSVDPRQRAAVSALYHLTHALDGTRPTLGNDGWEYVVGDMVGVHDYTHVSDDIGHSYSDRAAVIESGRVSERKIVLSSGLKTAASKPIILSEFGGLTLADSDGAWAGYGGVGTAEDLVASLADLVGAVRSATALAGFCYTQLTDTEQERNGLMTENREPKADLARLREILGG